MRETTGLNVAKNAGAAARNTYIFGAPEDIVNAAVKPTAATTETSMESAEEEEERDSMFLGSALKVLAQARWEEVKTAKHRAIDM